MDINDLKSGDVLLFSGDENDFISRAIMWLTDSTVSHAAMTYTPNSVIVEETPPAVQKNEAAERFVGRTITVRRLDPPQPTYQPVLNAAEGYLNHEDPYATANLFFLAMLLIYRKFTPHNWFQEIAIKILKKVTADILKFFYSHTYPGRTPMVCSQFVYQCYEDAGQDYQLQIQGGLLATQGESLIDLAIARVISDTTPAFQAYIQNNVGLAATAPVQESDEQLAEELLTALQQEANLPAEAAQPTLQGDLVVAIHEFGQAIQAVRTGVAPVQSELFQANAQHMASQSLALLKSEEAIFVTPADLLSNCQNLTTAGTING